MTQEERFARVLLAADALTREPTQEGHWQRWDALCAACEDVTDEELDALRETVTQA